MLPAPYDGTVAAGLDATDGLGQAGTESQSTRTWQIETPVDPHAVDGPHPLLRPVLVVVRGRRAAGGARAQPAHLRAARRSEGDDS